MGPIDAECDLGSISGGLSGEFKMLRASDQNDRMTPLFKSLRVRNQKKTPKMEFFLDRFKTHGHSVIRSHTELNLGSSEPSAWNQGWSHGRIWGFSKGRAGESEF